MPTPTIGLKARRRDKTMPRMDGMLVGCYKCTREVQRTDRDKCHTYEGIRPKVGLTYD